MRNNKPFVIAAIVALLLLICILMTTLLKNVIEGTESFTDMAHYNTVVTVFLVVTLLTLGIVSLFLHSKNRECAYMRLENEWNEYKFDTIKNGFNDGLFEFDFKAKKLIYNEAFEKLFVDKEGYCLEDFKDCVFDDDLPKCLYFFDNKVPEGEKCTIEIRIRDNISWSFKWYNLSILVRYGSDGKPNRVIGMLQNIDTLMVKKQAFEIEARFDSLTGLLNRRYIEFEVKQVIARGEEMHAFIIIDVNDFKQINDVYGHKSGDEALKHVAAVLKKVFRRSDLIGRIGGDEFVVLMLNIPGRRIVDRSIERFMEELEQTEGKLPFSVICSAGISFSPDDGGNYDALFKRADLALYEAKETLNCRFFVYGSDEYAHSKLNRFSQNDALVYIANRDTKEVLYINPPLAEWLDAHDNPVSELCFERIMNRGSPCADCPADAWEKSGKIMHKCQFPLNLDTELDMTVSETTWGDCKNAVIVSVSKG